jgi:hypothetical protein
MTRRGLGWNVLIVVFAASCTSAPEPPDFPRLYNQAAQYHGSDRNPVIVIPGILGSRLVDSKSNRVVWGAFAGDYADPRDPEGARLVALPMALGTPLGALKDDVVPDGVLRSLTIEVLGLPIELGAYVEILRTLGVGGYRDQGLAAVDYGEEHFTCFQFDYDWRRDNVENARRFHEFLLEKRAYVQGELKKRYGVDKQDLKFDVVAHSMGGLVLRYYLAYGTRDLPADGSVPEATWEGARYVDRAIIVGTPNAGSARALVELVEGEKFAPILPEYSPALLGTMPSVYQLLPRARHGCAVEAGTKRIEDLYDPALWERMRWGLAAPAQDELLRALLPDVAAPEERRRIALDHLKKCLDRAKAFAAALDAPAAPPPGLELFLVAGDALPTPAVIDVDPQTGAVSVAESAAGDGTVLRTSALLDERMGKDWQPWVRTPIRWDQVTFLSAGHLALTKDAAFTNNVLYILLEDPRRRR